MSDSEGNAIGHAGRLLFVEENVRVLEGNGLACAPITKAAAALGEQAA